MKAPWSPAASGLRGCTAVPCDVRARPRGSVRRNLSNLDQLGSLAYQLVSIGMRLRPYETSPRIAVGGVATVAKWGFWERDAVLVARTYLDALVGSGAVPIVIPPLPGIDPGEALLGVDGLLLVGGVDVDPARYGQPPTERMEETSDLRDEFELAMVRLALERDIPMLGICRGLQVMNVATGGSLHQHLVDVGYAEHRPVPGSLGVDTSHEVQVEADSHLARCGMGVLALTNSHHHQGIAIVGDGGRVVARATADGVVEAIEWSSSTFALGVQWHPEEPRMSSLFDALVAAARSKRPAVPCPSH